MFVADTAHQLNQNLADKDAVSAQTNQFKRIRRRVACKAYAAAGKKVGVLGTVAYRWPGFSRDASLTTPDCLTIHENLAAMAEAAFQAARLDAAVKWTWIAEQMHMAAAAPGETGGQA